MIDPKSLRIGNYVDINGPVKIVGFSPFGHSTRCDEPEGCIIHFDSVDGKHIGWECDSTDCDPIPLSEQELIRLGFEKDAHGFQTSIGGQGSIRFYLPRTGNGTFCQLGTKGGYRYNEPPAEYVHQLQNLYYSLTGTELTYKV